MNQEELLQEHRSALDLLAPLYGEKATFDGWRADERFYFDTFGTAFRGWFGYESWLHANWLSCQRTPPDCAGVLYAGKRAGTYLFLKRNRPGVALDAPLKGHQILQACTSAENAKLVYHAERCGGKGHTNEYHPEDLLDRLASGWWRQLFEGTWMPAAYAAISEFFGHLLFRGYREAKLAEFARMPTEDAVRFLGQTAERELANLRKQLE